MTISQTLNGYDLFSINRAVFGQYAETNPQANRRRLALLKSRLDNHRNKTTFISLGENCGPSLCMKKAGLETLGSNYFDNIVTPSAAIPELLRSAFSQALQLTNLSIGTWEGHDSVLDEFTGIYFHHYFHLRGAETKVEIDSGTGREKRLIHKEDVPLFYPIVKSQFEYLAQKFLAIARHDAPKIYVIRQIDGTPFECEKIYAIKNALNDLGAVNFKLAQVIDNLPGCAADSLAMRDFLTWPIDVTDERWGAPESWLINAYDSAGVILLRTAHGTYLHRDSQGKLFHGRLGGTKEGLPVVADAKKLLAGDASIVHPGGSLLLEGMRLSISINNLWLCADPSGMVAVDRVGVGAWEVFSLEEFALPLLSG